MTISNGNAIEFANEARAIKGYTYQSAHYGTYNGAAVAKVVASSDGGLLPTRYLKFYNGNTQVKKLTRSEFGGTKTADVYLVYKADETGGGGSSGGAITEEQSLTREKYVTPNEDGSYDLSLTVSGAKGTQANPAKLDIVLVLDKSGSMDDPISNNDRTTRLQAIKNAANTFIGAVGSNQSIDAKYKVITFSGPSSFLKENQEPGTCAWMTPSDSSWSSAASAKRTISNITANGGTNYQAALKRLKTH